MATRALAIKSGSLRPLPLKTAPKLVDPSFASHARVLFQYVFGEDIPGSGLSDARGWCNGHDRRKFWNRGHKQSEQKPTLLAAARQFHG